MNENNKKYWVELSTSTGDLKVYGDRPWGAPSWISNAPFRLTKAQAWAKYIAKLVPPTFAYTHLPSINWLRTGLN